MPHAWIFKELGFDESWATVNLGKNGFAIFNGVTDDNGVRCISAACIPQKSEKWVQGQAACNRLDAFIETIQAALSHAPADTRRAIFLLEIENVWMYVYAYGCVCVCVCVCVCAYVYIHAYTQHIQPVQGGSQECLFASLQD